MDLIKIAEEAFATGKQHPKFKAGDTVTVAYKIIEGSTKNAYRTTAALLSRFPAMVKRSVSPYARCRALSA